MRPFAPVVLLLAALSGAAVGAPLEKAALAALVKRAGELDTDALVVIKDGRVVIEKWFDGAPRSIESMSVTKSVVALAFGRLVTTGKLKSLDEPVCKWYAEWRQGRKRAITVRHLLTQTSGLQALPSTEELYASPDFVQLALCAELTDAPGTKFFYNNKATNLLAGLVKRIGGKRLDEYLKEEVFAPLGITDVEWTLDAAGNPHGMSGLHIRPADLAKLGQLMLDRGRWRGREILSRAWVKDATTPTSANAGYGQLWWLIDEATSTIDDGCIDAWRKAGVSEKFISAILPLKGRMLQREQFFDAIAKALADQGGLETWHDNTWRRGLPDVKVLERKVVGLRADGWQGQAVIVLLPERLVVVRMREPSAANSEEENRKYGFPELVKMARALVGR